MTQGIQSDHTVKAAALQYLRRLTTTSQLLPTGCDEFHITLFGHGCNNRLYDVRSSAGSWVLKVYPRGREARMFREYAALRLLEHVPAVPQAVWGEPEAKFLDTPVLLYWKAPGRPILESGVVDADLNNLSALWLRIHHTELPRDTPLSVPAGPVRPRECLDYIYRTTRTLIRMADDRDHRFRAGVDRLKEYVRRLEVQDLKEGLWNNQHTGLCQVDSRLGNMVKDENGSVWLVDWEHAGLMDPAYEVAGFFSHPEAAIITPAQRDRCIRAYCQGSDDTCCYDKIMVYLTILPVQWMARILTLIADDGQPVQPWVTPTSKEDLWRDVDRYQELAGERLSGALFH